MSEYNLRYRPQKISELDLATVREDLSQVFKSKKTPQAFLFSGPRGIGKTSAARIVAKVVNCVGKKGEDFEPCNSCPQCLSITSGNNLDVLEIDAASNRGIDDIRDLREKVRLVPFKAAFKVYIIDEAHMLTNEAFNALLKTLEEPPKHVIFILCTTEPEKLPETIISRCLRFNFKKAKDEEVLEKLAKIAKKESLEVTVGAFREIIKGASGSFRDALKILEQASFAGSKIDEEQVRNLLGQIVGFTPEKLFEFLAQKDTKGGIEEINRVVEMGGNLRIYTGQLLESLRQMLLAKIGITETEVSGRSQENNKASVFEIADLKKLIEVFSKASLELKEAIIPQLPLELAVVEWCEREKDAKVGQPSARPQTRPSSEEVPVVKDSASPTKQEPDLSHSDLAQTNEAFVEGISSPQQNKKISLGEIQERWQEVLLGVRPRNFSIEAFLRACRPIAFDGQFLTIEVFYQFHKDKLESDKCRGIVEEVVNQIFGVPLALKCTLGSRPQVAKKEEPIFEEQFSDLSVSKAKLDGKETADEDILKVAEEIFSSKGAD